MSGVDLRALGSQERQLVSDAIDRGWTLRRTGSGHYLLTHPAGGSVTVQNSPSDWRAGRNLRSQIRRIDRRHFSRAC